MTRSRICPDTESTGLSPASDALPVRETTEQFAQVFFGKSVSLLTPEERFTTVYAGSRDIPADLHPASWFPADTWFRNELRACAAYVHEAEPEQDRRAPARHIIRIPHKRTPFSGPSEIARDIIDRAGCHPS
ncbi:hypothetical protein F1331_26330 [Salmonella enterica subsp. enterica serovar Dessau]|uniref:Cytoplasmic protein n=1 Tax=Salmonella enterica subsp. enterica serovar Dessau TaxID=2564349 RepID=A0A8E5INB5_SALET|nr:hypothetical protein F1331_26330 [Salmonella enterica subsp. enterica serovar Dessau]